MTRYRILTWRDIPLQLKVRDEAGRSTAIELDQWYTEHADRVAMATGLYGRDAYLEAIRWSPWLDRQGDPAEVASSIVAELDATWAPIRERWQQTGDLGV